LAKEGKDTQDASTERITQHVQVRAHARSGRGQLSLVEHALCPLDTAVSLKEGFIYEVEYLYTDEQRHMKKAKVRVGCLSGLSPNDEFYLWGLLALTFQQPEPSTELYATPHYLLKQLGCLDAGSDGAKGGENYRIFREALARLADVTYKNERFYDPIRGEHRDVSFGFLSYSLPIDPNSSRAWRLTWNTHFFEFCKAAGGYLFFDLETYRELDVASRRLFLTLKKVFHRSPTSPVYDVRHLAVNVLGFRAGLETWRYTDHLKRCAAKLVRHQIIELPESGVKGLFKKNGKGSYTIQFRRGRYFEKPEASRAPATAAESAMYEPLRAIGFDDAAIARIVTTYRPELIQTWADITLAAKEKHGSGFFKRSPQAYFLDNLKKAAEGRRTPPDWWLEHRKEEDRREREAKRRVLGLPISEQAANAEQDEEKAFEEYLKGEAREAMQAIVEQTVKEFQALGLPAEEIARRAADHARRQMRGRFRQEHPEYEQPSGPKPLGDILRAFVRPLRGPADHSPPTPTSSPLGKPGKASPGGG
jgi:hypothetical protein